MSFSGMLNCTNGWNGIDRHNKWMRVELLQKGFFRPGKFLVKGKYTRYSKSQPDLIWSSKQCYHGQRNWNFGRNRHNKHFSLFYCKV